MKNQVFILCSLRNTIVYTYSTCYYIPYGPVAVGDMDMQRTIELYEHLQSLHVQVMSCSETPCTHIAHENKTQHSVHT